jgi:tRNA(Arg) A34 adenosine deaminase TadA
MPTCDRRAFVTLASLGAAGALVPSHSRAAPGVAERFFIAEALRMRNEAVAAGDQPFGAVLVKTGAIVGYGPSRVVTDRSSDAHAERVALWDAQRRLATSDLAGAVMYSTSRPCAACQNALAIANVERMYFGPEGADAGKPRRF